MDPTGSDQASIAEHPYGETHSRPRLVEFLPSLDLIQSHRGISVFLRPETKRLDGKAPLNTGTRVFGPDPDAVQDHDTGVADHTIPHEAGVGIEIKLEMKRLAGNIY